MDFMTAIIPDPDYLHGQCRKEIHGDTPEELAANVREWIQLDTHYGASDIGSQFNVFRDGAQIGTLMYNGTFHWADPLLQCTCVIDSDGPLMHMPHCEYRKNFLKEKSNV